MDTNRFTRVDPTAWRIEPHGAMRVPAVIYADEDLIRDMDDKVYVAFTGTEFRNVQAHFGGDRWKRNLEGCAPRGRKTGKRSRFADFGFSMLST